jgi:hypothetical protein
LFSIAAGVYQVRHSHVWAKRHDGSKINKDKLIKVTIGLAEPMRESDTIICLLMSQGAEGFTMGFKRVQGGSEVIRRQFMIQRYKPLVENHRNKQ